MKDDDNLTAGLTIDLADINYIFMKWFDGTYHDILEWKEKAQRWSTHEAVAYSRAMDFTKTWIEKDKLTKLEEKAKMWDELGEELKDSLPTKTRRQIEEKAKKYDELPETYKQLVEKHYDLETKLKRYDENANFWFNWCSTCAHHQKMHKDIGSCLECTLQLSKKSSEYEAIRCNCTGFKQVKPIFPK